MRENLKIAVQEQDINNVYVLKSKEGPSKPIKVVFVTYPKKAEILKNAYRLKDQKIFIAQDLCVEDRQEHKIIVEYLKHARIQNIPAKILSGNRLLVNGEIYEANQLNSLNCPQETNIPEEGEVIGEGRQNNDNSTPTTPSYRKSGDFIGFSSSEQNQSLASKKVCCK